MDSIPSVPPGWSIGPNGEAISPDGEIVPPTASGLPLLSIVGGAVAGKLIGKSTTWMLAGAIAGYWLKPLE